MGLKKLDPVAEVPITRNQYHSGAFKDISDYPRVRLSKLWRRFGFQFYPGPLFKGTPNRGSVFDSPPYGFRL